MANTKLSFYGTKNSETENHSLSCFSNIHNEVYLEIDMLNYSKSFICIDKSTAIKLHRELKKQISFLESEVYNG